MKRTAVILSLLATGCGTTWTQPGKTAHDFQADTYACQREASAQPAASAEAISMKHRCMQLRGWRAM